MDNLYYFGKVLLIGNGQVNVLFDDNDFIIYRILDVLVVIFDKVFYDVVIGYYVVVIWKGGNKYFIGYVFDKDFGNCVKVIFDDNDEDYYIVSQLRIFFDYWLVYEGQYRFIFMIYRNYVIYMIT